MTRSTIQDTLNGQHRDSLTEEMVGMMNYCPGGDGKHKWRLMEWSRQQDVRPIYSIYSPGPVMHEMGHASTSAKMICFCGVSVEVKRVR